MRKLFDFMSPPNGEDYFRDDREAIARENLSTIFIACLCGLMLCFVLFLIAPFIIRSWSITREYWLLPPILLSFVIFAGICKFTKFSVPCIVVDIASASLFVALLLVFIAISVFPYPDTPQIYVTLCFMLMPVTLIQRPRVLLIIYALSEALFLLLVVKFKTTSCAQQDIFNSIASLLFSLIVMNTTNRLRQRDYRARMEFKRLSVTDQLTGLLNKASFEAQCRAYLDLRRKDERCALMIIDIDDFKAINDTYGHHNGDLLLHAMGELINGTFRQSDIKGRVGGDEFGVMLAGAPGPNEIRRRLAGLQRSLLEVSGENVALHATCSIGVIITDKVHVDYNAMFSAADAAMYEVKGQTKNGSIFHNIDDMN